jgi:hypothetical protein
MGITKGMWLQVKTMESPGEHPNSWYVYTSPLKLYSKSIDPSPSLSNVTNSTVQCGKFAMMVIDLQPSSPLWADLLFNAETGAALARNRMPIKVVVCFVQGIMYSEQANIENAVFGSTGFKQQHRQVSPAQWPDSSQ